jgi:hypothetical protein
MKIRDILEITPNVQNIVVTFRSNGRYVIRYNLGEGVKPSRFERLREETDEGFVYDREYNGSIQEIYNETPIVDCWKKVIPKKILDSDIHYMIPWNVYWRKENHYQYEFTVDIGDRIMQKPKSKKKSKDDGQMSLDFGEVEE